MGPFETELRSITDAGEWRVPELTALIDQVVTLVTTVGKLADNPGWDGAAADAASQQLASLVPILNDVIVSGGNLITAMTNANTVRNSAVALLPSLPATLVPDWVYDTIDKGGDVFPFMDWYFDAQNASLSAIENLLVGNREQSANEILTAYRSQLVPYAIKASSAGATLPYVPDLGAELPDPLPEVPEFVYGPPPGSRGPVPPGFAGPPPFPPPPERPEPPTFRPPPQPPQPPFTPPEPPRPPVGPTPDDPGPGVIPTPPGTGIGGPGTTHIGTGVGVGAATLAAGVGAKAVGLGAGGFGAAGAARPGAGGLLGGGAPGGAGAAGRSGAARSGGGLLGNGNRGGAGTSGSGGRDDKKRTSGRGLGGAIAPHLDDDETYVPRGAGTRAGGRDDADDAEPFEPATD